jgi:hypothetical protein
MRPKVCMSDSTSNASAGRAQKKRRSPERRGDCTRAWKRTSASAGSALANGTGILWSGGHLVGVEWALAWSGLHSLHHPPGVKVLSAGPDDWC